MRRRGSRLINFGRVFRRRMAFDVRLKCSAAFAVVRIGEFIEDRAVSVTHAAVLRMKIDRIRHPTSAAVRDHFLGRNPVSGGCLLIHLFTCPVMADHAAQKRRRTIRERQRLGVGWCIHRFIFGVPPQRRSADGILVRFRWRFGQQAQTPNKARQRQPAGLSSLRESFSSLSFCG